jgi:hypothetical protein
MSNSSPPPVIATRVAMSPPISMTPISKVSKVIVVLHIRKPVDIEALIAPIHAQDALIDRFIIHLNTTVLDHEYISKVMSYGVQVCLGDANQCRIDILDSIGDTDDTTTPTYLLIIDQDRQLGHTSLKSLISAAEKYPNYSFYGYWGWRLGTSDVASFHTNSLIEVDYLCGAWFGLLDTFRQVRKSDPISVFSTHTAIERTMYDDITLCLAFQAAAPTSTTTSTTLSRCLVIPMSGDAALVYKPENSTRGPDTSNLRNEVIKQLIKARNYQIVQSIPTALSSDDVTVVITACGRPLLLEITLFTFLKFNRYPISQIIVTEDSGIPGINAYLEQQYPAITWIKAEQRRGQIESIDAAYKLVRTPYVFHLEEDWIFYRFGVIEESFRVLREAEAAGIKVSAVTCRAHGAGDKHLDPAHPSLSLVRCTRAEWGYFTFNPGLRSMKDYYELCNGAYSSITSFDRQNPSNSEYAINALYKEKGYRLAITKNPEGYCTHIGDEFHVW